MIVLPSQVGVSLTGEEKCRERTKLAFLAWDHDGNVNDDDDNYGGQQEKWNTIYIMYVPVTNMWRK